MYNPVSTLKVFLNSALFKIGCAVWVFVFLVIISGAANAASLMSSCDIAGRVAIDSAGSSDVLGCFIDPSSGTLKWQLGRTSAIDLNVPQCLVGVQSAGAALTFIFDPHDHKYKFMCDDVGTPNVNGQCSATAGACTAGTATSAVYGGFYDPVAGAALVFWSCVGSGSGTSVGCTAWAPSTNGVCSSSFGACTSGTSTPPSFDGVWTCTGSGLGGTIAYCGGAGADDDSSKLQSCIPPLRLYSDVNNFGICRRPNGSSVSVAISGNMATAPISVICAASGGNWIATSACR